MRWFIGIVVTIVVVILIYLGSAAWSLAGLIAAAREGNGAAVMERIDVPSDALADQPDCRGLAGAHRRDQTHQPDRKDAGKHLWGDGRRCDGRQNADRRQADADPQDGKSASHARRSEPDRLAGDCRSLQRG